MRWYSYVLIAVALGIVVLLLRQQGGIVDTQQTAPTGLLTGQPAEESVASRPADGLVELDLFVVDGGFVPNVLEADEGDTVRITLGSDTEIDLEIPQVHRLEMMTIGNTIEFEAPDAGEYEFYCLTCEPAMYGTLVVHE